MIHVRASRANRIRLNAEIINFYTNLWYDRLVNLTKRKYAYALVWRNVRNVLTFYGKTFDDNQLKVPTLITWKSKGWRELIYKKWHFAVVVQLDMFDNNIAIVQDCCHDKDYHNDTLETESFKMDNPDDKSHLVDWKEIKLKSIIQETINQYLKRNIMQ